MVTDTSDAEIIFPGGALNSRLGVLSNNAAGVAPGDRPANAFLADDMMIQEIGSE